jgi:hypothetical protein
MLLAWRLRRGEITHESAVASWCAFAAKFGEPGRPPTKVLDAALSAMPGPVGLAGRATTTSPQKEQTDGNSD